MAGFSWDQLELTQLRWVWKDLTGRGFARFGWTWLCSARVDTAGLGSALGLVPLGLASLGSAVIGIVLFGVVYTFR